MPQFRLGRFTSAVAATLETPPVRKPVRPKSGHCFPPGPGRRTAYTASEHAVAGITKNSAFVYGPSGIRTNAVTPGLTATGIEGTMSSPFARERLSPFMTLIPPVVDADQMAASIT
ncbi:SDR family NAD(P)-dependent oxidoreductase [Pseudarthrobacter sp. NS4]|uniref:SDR family NAD(P)-dependent oxidoreductase n=1 Tax=Pseudarthrobacter sp. NS4 TaxID=2973976 RepID=UPI0021616433|nr:SDR family NAD(P)-dependent oxidoreductase [Pseudarthrobacter sp. NS4]